MRTVCSDRRSSTNSSLIRDIQGERGENGASHNIIA